jgi:N,N'-diacetylchitobiose phosphorylase
MELYDSLCPASQNDMIEIRKAEPYSYCQFISGRDHTAFGEAHHPFMTGTGGWAYFAAAHYILGIAPGLDSLTVNPCIPNNWNGFKASRRFRSAMYHITVENPHHVSKGVAEIVVDGNKVDSIPLLREGQSGDVKIVMG